MCGIRSGLSVSSDATVGSDGVYVGSGAVSSVRIARPLCAASNASDEEMSEEKSLAMCKERWALSFLPKGEPDTIVLFIIIIPYRLF